MSLGYLWEDIPADPSSDLPTQQMPIPPVPSVPTEHSSTPVLSHPNLPVC